MENRDYDKVIDAILRGAREEDLAVSEPLTAFPAGNGAHLDAEDISAFAENALPEKTRLAFTGHLAECTRCRRILANIAILGSGTTDEPAAAPAAAPAADFAVPWYRRIFAFPQVAYVMGALVVAFAGVFGYLVLQNARPDESVASQKETSAPRPSANTASAANTNSAPAVATNSVALPTTAANSRPSNSTPASSDSPVPTGGERDEDLALAKNVPSEEKAAPVAQATPPPDLYGNVKEEELKTERRPEAVPVPKPKPVPEVSKSREAGATGGAPEGVANAKTEDRREESKDKKIPSEPSKKIDPSKLQTVGGKTFRNVGGVWTDSQYDGSPATRVRRNTDDYRKLDSGLRSIADRLKGPVIVVWTGRAYRID